MASRELCNHSYASFVQTSQQMDDRDQSPTRRQDQGQGGPSLAGAVRAAGYRITRSHPVSGLGRATLTGIGDSEVQGVGLSPAIVRADDADCVAVDCGRQPDRHRGIRRRLDLDLPSHVLLVDEAAGVHHVTASYDERVVPKNLVAKSLRANWAHRGPSQKTGRSRWRLLHW